MRFNRDHFSIEAAVEKGRALPEWFLQDVEIDEGDSFYLKAFKDLDTCRPGGMGLCPIPWTAIILYAEKSQLDWDLEAVLVKIIQTMDHAYMEWAHKEAEKKRNKE